MTAVAHRAVRAVIEYDGTAFAGSQVQPNARTVQGELETALNKLIGERTRVHLAGRTDAGVHATGQVAAFRLPPGEGLSRLRERLNAVLPQDLVVRSLSPAPQGFDPRRDARWRVYRYRILMNGARRPLDRHRTLEIDDRLDVSAMREAAARMVGHRDYAALGTDANGRTMRHLAEVRVTGRGNLIEVRVTANAFLRRMVRSIVAILMAVGLGRLAPEAVDRLLVEPRRALHGQAAPPHGLTLERVVYESADNRTNDAAARSSAAGDNEGKPESS
jgi:tRNA pseudouridine38-40 synthase